MISRTINPVFTISGSDPIEGTAISPPNEEGGMGAMTIILIVVVLLAGIGAALFFSGVVSFEEDDDSDDENSEENASSSTGELMRSDEHPGWLWDPQKEEWVPDPDHIA